MNDDLERCTSSRVYILYRESLYLLACHVGVTVGNSGLGCCVHVTSFEANQLPVLIFCIIWFFWS